MSFVKTIDKAIKMCDDSYSSRKAVVIKLYNQGKIKQDVFGQLAIGNFSDDIINKAIERKWIDQKLGKQILSM